MGNKFRNAINRFLYGRYGADNLYNALFIVSLILIVISSVFNILGYVERAFAIVSIVLYALSGAVIVWMIFRFFSRNTAARRKENQVWLRFLQRFRKKPAKRLPPDTADHIFRACPHCDSTLRLPHIPGKHEVKCPRCSKKFRVHVKK